jgi:hypothetical protein
LARKTDVCAIPATEIVLRSIAALNRCHVVISRRKPLIVNKSAEAAPDVNEAVDNVKGRRQT